MPETTETKIAHTPGPWELGQYTNYIGFGIWAAGRGCIAERWYDSVQQAPYGNEIVANARLIAAAPDLLDIAKARLAGLYDDLHSGMSAEQFDAHPDVVSTRAAIDKAEGR